MRRKPSKRELLRVRKKLVGFVKKEYEDKKPKKIKLIQVKPRVQFKKGTMLPNLIIKSLQTAAYVILVDYGKEYRIYFFSLAGRSMGANNMKNRDLVEKELKGLGKTIYQLPKPDPFSVLRDKTEILRKRAGKLREKIEHHFSVKIEIKRPFVVVKYFKDKEPAYSPYRLGIRPRPDTSDFRELYFEQKYSQPPYQDFILSREIFLQIFESHYSKDIDFDESLHAIATFLALVRKFGYRKWDPVLEKMRSYESKRIYLKKFLQWLFFLHKKKILAKQTSTSASIYTNFVLKTIMTTLNLKNNNLSGLLGGKNINVPYPVHKYYVLWLMGKGWKKVSFWHSISIPKQINRRSWLYSSLFSFLLSKIPLMKKYRIRIISPTSLPCFWYFMVIHTFLLKARGAIQWDVDDRNKFLVQNQGGRLTLDEQERAVISLENLNIPTFVSLFNTRFGEKGQSLLMELLRILISEKILSVRHSDFGAVRVGQSKELKCNIKNHARLDFLNLSLSAYIDPENRANAKIMPFSKTHIGPESELDFTILLKPNSTGLCRINLEATFDLVLQKGMRTSAISCPLTALTLKIVS